MHSSVFLRNVDAGEFFEDFLIFAVAAILGFRLVLHLTGYPSLGGATFHIAHMLPGGMLMLASLLLLLGYLGSGVKRLAAFLGGAGFGTFIDELGKFVTRDNDYFFKPTAALIYLVFVLTYLIFRATRKAPLSRAESVANALEMLVEAVRHDLDTEEKARALELLRRSPPGDPVAHALEGAFSRIQALPAPRLTPVARLKARLERLYQTLIARRWFSGVVVLFFVAYSIGTLAKAAVIARDLGPAVAVLATVFLLGLGAVRAQRAGKRAGAIALYALTVLALGAGGAASLAWTTLPGLGFFDWGELVSSAVPGLLVLMGIFRLGRSRLAAYRAFERAVLFEIFVTQFFAFYHAEFVAALGLLVNLLVFATLRYSIHREAAHEGPPGGPGRGDGSAGLASA